MELITRMDLAKRWQISMRTIDRKRRLGLVPWVDLAQGQGARPCVRFRLADIETLESRMVKGPVMEARRDG